MFTCALTLTREYGPVLHLPSEIKLGKKTTPGYYRDLKDSVDFLVCLLNRHQESG